MMEPEQLARRILGGLAGSFRTPRAGEVARLLDDEVVLFGTAAANLERAQTDAYVARVMDQQGTVRWGWDQVVPVLHEPGVLAFAVVGTVGFEDTQGQSVGERDAFHLTCPAVLRDGQ